MLRTVPCGDAGIRSACMLCMYKCCLWQGCWCVANSTYRAMGVNFYEGSRPCNRVASGQEEDTQSDKNSGHGPENKRQRRIEPPVKAFLVQITGPLLASPG